MSLATSAKIDEILNLLGPNSYEIERMRKFYNDWVESADAIAGTADNVDAISQIATFANNI